MANSLIRNALSQMEVEVDLCRGEDKLIIKKRTCENPPVRSRYSHRKMCGLDWDTLLYSKEKMKSRVSDLIRLTQEHTGTSRRDL